MREAQQLVQQSHADKGSIALEQRGNQFVDTIGRYKSLSCFRVAAAQRAA